MNDQNFDWFDEFPQDDPFVQENDDLKYRDEVSQRLIDTIHEFLAFSTTRDLLKLLAANL